MIKKIILTESQFNYLLESASLNDIYDKYYSNIDNDIFMKIIQADPTYNVNKPQKMGKYGKWLLNIYKNGKLMIEDLYKATNYLKCFIDYYNVIKEKDITKIKSLQELYDIVRPYLEGNSPTSKSDEIRKIKEGAEKVYEDNEWIIIIPHTKEASCYYGKGTQWCTAADYSNNMFDHYNIQGSLYININKVTKEKFQFHFETNSFMDENDREIKSPIAYNISLSQGACSYYANNVENSDAIFVDKQYVLETENCTLVLIKKPEDEYWDLKDEYNDEIVARNLIFNDNFEAYDLYGYELENSGYCTFKNAYGNRYTLITYNKNNGDVDMIYNNITYSQEIDEYYDDNIILSIVKNDGSYEIMILPTVYTIYTAQSDDVINAEVIAYDVVKVNKRNGYCDLISINNEMRLDNIDTDIDISDDNEYLLTYDMNGNDLVIRIEDLEIMDGDEIY
jgi:hypothetical protein